MSEHEHDWQLWLHPKSNRFASNSPPKKCYFVCECGKYKLEEMEEIETDRFGNYIE